MVNKGQIHMELGKFLMISSNLIKLDDESVIEIGENSTLWKRTLRRIQWIKNQWIWLWFRGEIEDWREMIFLKHKIAKLPKLRMKITQITILS